MADAYQETKDEEMYVIAWQTAYLLNVHVKKKITPEKLLGKKKNKKMDPIEISQKLNEIDSRRLNGGFN